MAQRSASEVARIKSDGGRLLIWIGSVPGFEFKPDETLRECLERGVREWREESRGPGGVDKFALRYADEVAALLRELG